MKTLLMVAFHFPPLAGSSGIQRTLRFVQQLPRHGWRPLVLTANPSAYETTSDDLLLEVPDTAPVRRAWALDTARHLSIGGRYPRKWALPDRWASWRFDAVRQGMALIRDETPSAIWSTYPIATAHRIGRELQQRSGLPWIADFRDPMTQQGHPSDPAIRSAYVEIEQAAMRTATACVVTTPGAARDYGQRFPEAQPKLHVIENGYDEASFAGLAQATPPRGDETLVLLHSGAIYPAERDPTALMQALGVLRREHAIGPRELLVRFRAAVHDDLLLERATREGVVDSIDITPAIAYRDALNEMCGTGALLVLQAANCNEQIPAKLYEYLRAGRPVVGLCDPAGDTWATLRAAQTPYLAPLDDAGSIAARLLELLRDHREGRLRMPHAPAVARASREARTVELATLLDGLVQNDRGSRSTIRSAVAD